MDTIARLQGAEEIRQLKARYFRLLDTKDYTAMAEVFTTDAVFDLSENTPPGPVTIGRVAIMTMIESAMAAKVSTHHGHCHEIELDSETTAHGVIAMEDDIREADGHTRRAHGAGHYTEQYRFEDGAWRISRTMLTRIYRDNFVSD